MDFSLHEFTNHTEDNNKVSFLKLPPLFKNGKELLYKEFTRDKNKEDSLDLYNMSPSNNYLSGNNSFTLNNLSPHSLASIRNLSINFPLNS